jgi:uncharacterized protein with HEPN domain
VRTDLERLEDILEAIGKLSGRVDAGEESFLRDEMLQVWMIHHLKVIGEAARGLSHDLRARYSEVPWAQVIAMRNILVHEYFGLNLRQVWVVVVRDLPQLREQVHHIVKSLREAGAKS